MQAQIHKYYSSAGNCKISARQTEKFVGKKYRTTKKAAAFLLRLRDILYTAGMAQSARAIRTTQKRLAGRA